ncbi:MAG: hypothetical protein H6704_13935 [Myxococcales bacterium]|nr:hypothetical protein [Myxococcales bacterium]MCB9537348.1 hypothetical protein [Myxococcales bacterium]
MIQKNVIWCPSIDVEIRQQMDNAIRGLPNMHGSRMEGAGCDLSDFDPKGTLYIIAHGHTRMPLATCNNRQWQARELVQMLIGAGLPRDWREIVLFICHAGESVNSKSNAQKLLDLRAKKPTDMHARGAQRKLDSLAKSYQSTQAKGLQPAPFTSEKQLLPFAAEFTQALKTNGFTHFRVTSYAAPVAQSFGDGVIRLALQQRGGQWGEPASRHPHLIKIWR